VSVSHAEPDSADLVERAHQAAHARVDRRLERRQVHVAQGAVRDIDHVVIAAGFRAAVGREVLGRSEDILLESPHPRRGHHGSEIRVLTGALGDASPAGVARDVDHGREGPIDAVGARFPSRHPGGRLDEPGIERSRLGEGDWEDRAIPVNHVQAEQQRNPQPRLLYGCPLCLTDRVDPKHVEEPTHSAPPDLFQDRGSRAGIGGRQIQLPELFLESHVAQQRVQILGAAARNDTEEKEKDEAGCSGHGDYRRGGGLGRM
jgi:hypothetical protein